MDQLIFTEFTDPLQYFLNLSFFRSHSKGKIALQMVSFSIINHFFILSRTTGEATERNMERSLDTVFECKLNQFTLTHIRKFTNLISHS